MWARGGEDVCIVILILSAEDALYRERENVYIYIYGSGWNEMMCECVCMFWLLPKK